MANSVNPDQTAPIGDDKESMKITQHAELN